MPPVSLALACRFFHHCAICTKSCFFDFDSQCWFLCLWWAATFPSLDEVLWGSWTLLFSSALTLGCFSNLCVCLLISLFLVAPVVESVPRPASIPEGRILVSTLIKASLDAGPSGSSFCRWASHGRREAELFSLLPLCCVLRLTVSVIACYNSVGSKLKPFWSQDWDYKDLCPQGRISESQDPDVYRSLSRRHQRPGAGQREGAEISPAVLSDLQEELQSLS